LVMRFKGGLRQEVARPLVYESSSHLCFIFFRRCRPSQKSRKKPILTRS